MKQYNILLDFNFRSPIEDDIISNHIVEILISRFVCFKSFQMCVCWVFFFMFYFFLTFDKLGIEIGSDHICEIDI